MWNWLKRLQIKGFAAGVLATALLLTGTMLVAANTRTVTRQITYGVNVMLNGEMVEFEEEDRPFTMGRRTFLPVRVIAEMMDLPVDFDPVTNTLILGREEARPGTPVSELFFDGTTAGDRVRTGYIRVRDSAIMGGNRYADVIRVTASTDLTIGGNATQNALLNLNRRSQWLNLSIGRIDGSAANNGTVRVYADDRLVESFTQNANALPTELRLFVEDVRLIRIRIVHNVQRNSSAAFAIAGFAE